MAALQTILTLRDATNEHSLCVRRVAGGTTLEGHRTWDSCSIRAYPVGVGTGSFERSSRSPTTERQPYYLGYLPLATFSASMDPIDL